MTTFDPTISPRIKPAWSAVLELLVDGEWHHRRDCIDVMLANSDLKLSTCSSVLRYVTGDGLLEQHGAWHGRGDDRRWLRLPPSGQSA